MSPETNVVPLAPRRMSAEDYKREREQIRATYGDNSAEATALRDQALARLFYVSGWTQEELGKAEGATQPYIGRKLLFGRFLSFMPSGHIPRNLSERRFRRYWERTDKTEGNERIRFQAVAHLIESDIRLHRRPGPKSDLGKRIVEHFADGKWHKQESFAPKLDAPDDDVAAVLENMRATGAYRCHCERKKVGASWSYRIFHHDGRLIALDALLQDLGPILERLKIEGRKTLASISPAAVAILAHELEQLIEKLAK